MVLPARRAELCQLAGPFKITGQRWGTHQRRPSGRLLPVALFDGGAVTVRDDGRA